MKYIATLVLLTGGVVAASWAWAEHHEEQANSWFDLENCEMCKSLGEHPELMSEMKWEVHDIENGMLMVAVVPEEHEDAWEEASKKMKQKANQITAESSLCGFCQSYGKLMEAGAKQQEIDSELGTITLLTAEDKETVKKIHEHAQQTREENEKLMAAAQ